MVTGTAPMRAVAYWTTSHSYRLGAQMTHAVARAHAAGEQAAGGERHLVPQLAIRRAVALLAYHQRLAIAEARHGAAQRLAYGQLQQGTSRGPAECESGEVVGSRSMSMSGEDAPGTPRFPPSPRDP
jgi:hypothetical protein